MQIDVRARGFRLSEALHAYAERRLRFTLPLHNPRIRRVVLRLTDVNGPRGGLDKRCRIEVALNGRQCLLAEDIEADAYVAIDRASERMARSLYRTMERTSARRPPARSSRTEAMPGDGA